MKKIAIVLLGSVLLAPVTKAQSPTDMSSFITAQKDDASKLIGAYLSPIVKGFSYGMTSGWYHTAKTHKVVGIDLGVTISGVMLPSSEQTFDPTKIGLSSSTVPLQTVAPTFIGPDITTKYNINYTQGPLTVSQQINGPTGADFKKNLGGNWVPVPMIQLGIGLIKNTDLKIRYAPEVNSKDYNVKLLGFGLMHDVKQYFPGVKSLPFDLSILAGYTSISGSSKISNTDTSIDGLPYTTDGNFSYKFNSWVVQALISKKVSVLTVYGGLGYGAVNTKLNMTGHYVLDPYATNQANPVTNPFSSSYSNNSMKLTVGMRLKLGPIYFNGDYTVQKYNALTIGMGVSVR